MFQEMSRVDIIYAPVGKWQLLILQIYYIVNSWLVDDI